MILPSDKSDKKNIQKKVTRTRGKTAVRDTVICAMLGALLLAVQIALAVLPNIELVSFLIIIYTLVLGVKALGAIYVFVFLEGIVYGFGLWWMNYLYVWTILFLAVYLIGKSSISRENPLMWAIVSAIYGITFGFWCSFPYFFIGGPSMMFSYWISGIPFDIPHSIGNFFAALILFVPVYKITCKLYSKMNHCN